MSNDLNLDLPDFKDDPKLWFYIWQTVNFEWEKAWNIRTDEAPAWWVGRMAGKLFRFREISGLADGYFHGSMAAGSGQLLPQGRKFQDNEFEIRKRIHEMLSRKGRFSEP